MHKLNFKKLIDIYQNEGISAVYIRKSLTWVILPVLGGIQFYYWSKITPALKDQDAILNRIIKCQDKKTYPKTSPAPILNLG